MGMPDFPERFLRTVWQRQLFTTTDLHTADGKSVTILSTGVPNYDGGPDFTGARIRIGNITFHGDVELHRDASAWHAHGHGADPHYNSVILHVVVTDDRLTPPARTAARRLLPLLVLHPFLDARFRDAWMTTFTDEPSGPTIALHCRDLNDPVPGPVIAKWIDRLAEERIELKIRRFEERIKQLVDENKLVVREPYPRYYGNPDEIPNPRQLYTKKDFALKPLWEQALYEGVLEGLGYSKNQAPFLALAQSVPVTLLQQLPLEDTGAVMAILFGAGGLLPSPNEVREAETRAYVRAMRRRWNKLRPMVKGPLLNEADWKFFRLRPNNFPTVRLAGFCFMAPGLFGGESFRRIIWTLKSDSLSAPEKIAAIHALFAFTPDEFWSSHYRFGARSRTPVASLGDARFHEILVNAVLPVVLLYARIFKDKELRAHARAVLAAAPAPQETSVLRVVESQLLKDRFTIKSALHHQGAHHLYKLYCHPVRCSECAVGRRVMPVEE